MSTVPAFCSFLFLFVQICKNLSEILGAGKRQKRGTVDNFLVFFLKIWIKFRTVSDF